MDGVSIVIATFNRSATLDATLERLERLAAVREIIVVDNGSGDGTAAMVRRRHSAAALIRLDTNCGAAARTVGVEAAHSEFVALCDDDCWYEEGTLQLAAALLNAYPRVAAVNARVVVGPAEVTDPACDAMHRAPWYQDDPRCHAIRAFMAGASTVRRSAFLAVGGFHAQYFFGAEELLASLDLIDAGWSIVYAPQAVVHHHPSPSGRDPGARSRLVARNRLWTVWLRGHRQQVVRYTRSAFAAAFRDRNARMAFVDALGGLPWILPQRHAAGPEAADALNRLLVSP